MEGILKPNVFIPIIINTMLVVIMVISAIFAASKCSFMDTIPLAFIIVSVGKDVLKKTFSWVKLGALGIGIFVIFFMSPILVLYGDYEVGCDKVVECYSKNNYSTESHFRFINPLKVRFFGVKTEWYIDKHSDKVERVYLRVVDMNLFIKNVAEMCTAEDYPFFSSPQMDYSYQIMSSGQFDGTGMEIVKTEKYTLQEWNQMESKITLK